jgi:hypothetical protein
MMYQLDEEHIETIDLYVVPRKQHIEYHEQISVGRIMNGVLCFVCAALLLLLPSAVDRSPWTLLVPLQLLPPQPFTASASISPTGTRVIPATNAHGWLTVYNGSFLVQQLPKGFIVSSTNGVEIVADASVTIPAGDPPTYGMARVSAHAAGPGSTGNIRALSVSSVYGAALYIKNLAPFTGGVEARTEPYATEQDQQAALSSARYRLKTQTKQPNALLDRPCDEQAMSANLSITVTWSCQFAQYRVPVGLHVLSVVRIGDSAKLEVRR